MVTVLPTLGLKVLLLSEKEAAVHPGNHQEWWCFEDGTAYTHAQDAAPCRHQSESYEGPPVVENWVWPWWDITCTPSNLYTSHRVNRREEWVWKRRGCKQVIED